MELERVLLALGALSMPLLASRAVRAQDGGAPAPVVSTEVETTQKNADMAQKNAETAQKNAETAQKNADDKVSAAKKQTDELVATIANARDGKLMAYGLTAGVGAAVLVPIGDDRVTFDEHVGVAAMPYLSFFPAYWGGTAQLNAYCASTHMDSDGDVATTAAMAVARARARRALDALQAGLSTGRYQKDVKCGGTEESDACESLGVLNAHVEAAANLPTGESPQRDQWIKDVANMYWNPMLRGKCIWRRFGFFVGIPLAASFNMTVDGGEASDRKLASRIAAGFTFAPNAYVQAMIGGASTSISVPAAKDGASDEHHGGFALLFALGGNLDILTALGGN